MKSKFLTICIISALLFMPSNSQGSENLLWVGYNNNYTDYSISGNGEINPTGSSLGFSTELSESSIFTISYGDLNGNIINRQTSDADSPIINAGEIDSQSLAIAVSWLVDDYSLTLSYGAQDSHEKSMTRFPTIIETIDGDDKIFSFSFDEIYSFDTWGFGYSLGSQYAVSDIILKDLVGTDPVTELNGQFDIKSWSAFVDLDFSLNFTTEKLTVSPKFTLSWDWELSNSGDELLTITRGNEQRTISRLTDRMVTTFRTPDSGLWELGLDVDWPSGWGVSVAYTQTIAAERDVKNISFDINVVF